MEKQKEINVGVIVRRSPNKSPWLKWSWKPICLLPGSVDKDWKLIREESGIFDFHVGSQILELHRAEVESYKVSLAMEPASAFVIMERDELENEDKEYKLHKVTASAYEAQDYLDSDEYLVEPVPMPQTLQALIEIFSDAHFNEKPFIKRKRDKLKFDNSELGKGDARVQKIADVFSSPLILKSRKDN